MESMKTKQDNQGGSPGKVNFAACRIAILVLGCFYELIKLHEPRTLVIISIMLEVL